MGFDDLFARVAGVFGRVEPRRWARSYLMGLLAPVERKNSWQLAEAAGVIDPGGLQHFLNRSRWSAEELRDLLREYVAEALAGPDGVFVLDETGFVKKGTKCRSRHFVPYDELAVMPKCGREIGCEVAV
ncbi:transposase [Nocardia sp. CA-084685]|uniref:transposase n=1 Tax=Nocardia sp. CA-084685 TaxID=3239970 RepID=UPI003D973C55